MAVADRLELVVVRHGLTAWNIERRYQGQRDIPLLLPEGQPGLDRLREALHGECFDAVYASDLMRCRQTLAHAYPGRHAAPIARFDARLRELDFGEYEGKRYADLQALPAYRAWIDSVGEQAPPGGESARALRQRLGEWLGELFTDVESQALQRVLIVTHGGVIRELRRRFEAIDFWEGSVGQAEGRRLTFMQREGRWQCSSSSAVPAPASARR